MNALKTIYTFASISGLCLAIGTSAFAKEPSSSLFSSWGKDNKTKIAQASDKKAGNKTAKAAPSPLPWQVNCSSNGVKINCAASQQLFLRKTRQLLLSITVRATPDKKNGVMMVQLPHGLHLPSGLKFKIDNEKEDTQQIQTCDQRGCYVGMPVKGALLKKMRSGKVLNVTFKNVNQKDIKISVPLKGFDQAFAKLVS
ncbi:MAG: invasion associated locus B family protein [Methyloligellaceae bacterium]